MPGWLAALGMAGLLLAIGAVLALVGWKRHVSAPLAVTRKTVKEDVQWAKERLAQSRTTAQTTGFASSAPRSATCAGDSTRSSWSWTVAVTT